MIITRHVDIYSFGNRNLETKEIKKTLKRVFFFLHANADNENKMFKILV
jgi:hypothetical protein